MTGPKIFCPEQRWYVVECLVLNLAIRVRVTTTGVIFCFFSVTMADIHCERNMTSQVRSRPYGAVFFSVCIRTAYQKWPTLFLARIFSSENEIKRLSLQRSATEQVDILTGKILACFFPEKKTKNLKKKILAGRNAF